MSQRNENTKRRLQLFTKKVRGGEDFVGFATKCTICGMSSQDSKREWNRHLTMHEKDGTLTREQYEQFIEAEIEKADAELAQA